MASSPPARKRRRTEVGDQDQSDSAHSELDIEDAANNRVDEEHNERGPGDEGNGDTADQEMESEELVSSDNGDDEEDEGDVPGPSAYKGFFRVEDGKYIPATEYLDGDWVKQIYALHQVEPIPIPQNMTLVPRDYQRMGAAQAHWLCESRFKGILVGDALRVGKTLMAILVMWMVKDEPGFSVVVAPEALCQHWIRSIKAAFRDGHGLKTYLFKGPSSITAPQLRQLGVDVVVVSYDDLAAPAAPRHWRRMYASTLHSNFWRDNQLPIKRLVLDEAHLANIRGSERHEAVKSLYYKAVIQLSGTLAHNNWQDFSGYIDFLSGHPPSSHQDFMETFSTHDYDGKLGRPDLDKTRLLQRFLQAFTIAHPREIFPFEQCHRENWKFLLESEEITNKIKRCIDRFRPDEDETEEGLVKLLAETDIGHDLERMAILDRARRWSVHHLLIDQQFDWDSDDTGVYDQPARTGISEEHREDHDTLPTKEKRDFLLYRIEAATHLYHKSNRLRQFVRVYKNLRTILPDRKIVVFSQFLGFLDIAAEILWREFNVRPLRYDGTVEERKRARVLDNFRAAHPKVPLFLTAGAGSYGPDLTCASIVIQTEVWWNANVEARAVSRLWGPGQSHEVLYVRLVAKDSAIDKLILRVQKRKAAVITDIMQPILCHPERELYFDIRPLRKRVMLPPMDWE